MYIEGIKVAGGRLYRFGHSGEKVAVLCQSKCKTLTANRGDWDDSVGTKHPLGLIEGATEHSAVVQALIDNLIERGLDPAVPRLFIIDGSKALSKAIRRSFGRHTQSNAVILTRHYGTQLVPVPAVVDRNEDCSLPPKHFDCCDALPRKLAREDIKEDLEAFMRDPNLLSEWAVDE